MSDYQIKKKVSLVIVKIKKLKCKRTIYIQIFSDFLILSSEKLQSDFIGLSKMNFKDIIWKI